MMQIPAGTFLMGSPEDELERLDREGPQHRSHRRSLFFMAANTRHPSSVAGVAAMPK
jgi:formylglycine-generating enzyme required for sulfatase activity